MAVSTDVTRTSPSSCAVAGWGFSLCCPCQVHQASAVDLTDTMMSLDHWHLWTREQDWSTLKTALGHVFCPGPIVSDWVTFFAYRIGRDWHQALGNRPYTVATGFMSQPGSGSGSEEHSGKRPAGCATHGPSGAARWGWTDAVHVACHCPWEERIALWDATECFCCCPASVINTDGHPQGYRENTHSISRTEPTGCFKPDLNPVSLNPENNPCQGGGPSPWTYWSQRGRVS